MLKVKRLTLLFLFLFPLIYTAAQNAPKQALSAEEPDLLEISHEKEGLKKMALEEIARGRYERALTYIISALKYVPNDEDLQNLRLSVMDILFLEGSAVSREQSEEGTDYLDFTVFHQNSEEELMNPDFAQEMLNEGQKGNFREGRNTLSFSIDGSHGQSQPVGLNKMGESDISQSSMITRLNGEFRYFFKEDIRKAGISLRYGGLLGYSTNKLDHMFILSFHYREFFSESLEARMTVGAKAGILFYIGNNNTAQGIGGSESSNGLTAGLYYHDAVLRYLFKNSSFFKKLVIELDFDFHFLMAMDNLNIRQFSMGGGYQFSRNWDLSGFSKITSSEANNTESSAIEGGVKLRYSY